MSTKTVKIGPQNVQPRGGGRTFYAGQTYTLPEALAKRFTDAGVASETKKKADVEKAIDGTTVTPAAPGLVGAGDQTDAGRGRGRNRGNS